MPYLVIKLTSYGEGAYPIGTFRSAKRAERLANKLNDRFDAKRADGDDAGESVRVLDVEPLDKFTDASIWDFAQDFINDGTVK